MVSIMNQNNLFILIVILIISCKDTTPEDNNKFEQAKIDFNKALNNFEECKTNYENKTNHKVIINVRNGAGKRGLAKEISDYLTQKCYDTYYSNWKNYNEFKTYIISYKKNNSMINELKDILDSEIGTYIINDTTKIEDMTLIIGKDYQSLSFYKTLNDDDK